MTRTDERTQHQPGLARIIGTIEEIGLLPTIPVVAQRAMAIAHDEHSSMREIANVIAQDHALAAAVLKVVNSAYYGLRQKVGTLPLALTILGVREIMDLVLGIAIISAFPRAPGNDLFSRAGLWRTSAQCAYAAKKLAHGVGLGRLGSEAFLGGLVRDIGLIVLDFYVHDEFMAVLRATRDEGLTPLEAEAKYLGTTHASVGAWLAEKWSFPASLVKAIAFHHAPAETSWDPPLTALVYLAELIFTLYEQELTEQEAAATIEADETWRQLMSSGPPVRPPSPISLLQAVGDEISAAPLIMT